MRFSHLTIGCLAAMLALGPAGAQTPAPRVVPESKAQVQLSFAPIVRQTAGSVVNVYAKRSERRQNALRASRPPRSAKVSPPRWIDIRPLFLSVCGIE